MLPLFIILVLYGNTAANWDDCGTRFAFNRYEPAISFGGKTLRSEFPWHVALYRQYNADENPEYFCGGSIIHPKVILTAAHCIFNETYSEMDNSTVIAVAGKYYISWEHRDPGEQRLKVVKKKIPITYKGFPNRYAEDIALLELNTTINYTSAIRPVCIDWSSEYLDQELPSVGTVVGWGLTENNITSDVLLMANLEYIEFTKCGDKFTNGFSLFITSDKFCAGLENGTAVQRGDSGGGLTFPRNTTKNKEQYYLYGIVSLKDTGRGNIAAFTDIRKHLHWLNVTLLSIIDPGLFEVGCPPFPSNSVSLVQCNLNGTFVDCNRGSKLGTKAKVHCTSSFHNDSLFKLYSETECSEGFKWTPLPESCIDCGKRYSFNTITPLVKFIKRNVSEYPWHAALYRKNKVKDLEYICGGTIIHPKAVITGAHCVYEETTAEFQNETDFLVAVGKYKSDWKEEEPHEQRFQVKKIHYRDTYGGMDNRFIDDIAIMELNSTINLSDYIMPVCIDWGGKLDLFKNPPFLGTAPGWGLTENGEISNELRSSKLRYFNCSKLERSGFSPFISTLDKFCAVALDGSIPEQGDSGGSLTFPYYNRETGEESNFLYGIISIKDVLSGVIGLSNVTYHLEWIKSTLVSIISQSSS